MRSLRLSKFLSFVVAMNRVNFVEAYQALNFEYVNGTD
jgi:hypothetical protein